MGNEGRSACNPTTVRRENPRQVLRGQKKLSVLLIPASFHNTSDDRQKRSTGGGSYRLPDDGAEV